MTPTATYIADENCLQELPRMEKPARDYDEYEPYSEPFNYWLGEWREYDDHLATLRKIPCDPFCKGLWADGQKVVEGKDYEVHSICGFYKTDCGKRKHCEDCRLVALPLVPAGEDELWDDVVTIVAGSWSREKIIAELKQKYSLTKR